MAKVRPFRAIRPIREAAHEIAALPYDVMNAEEAREMAEGREYSFLHISRSEIDLAEHTNPYDESVYVKARENLKKFIADGVMFADDKPSFYIYRQTMVGRTQTGIVGCAAVDDYLNNVIKKHELTRVEKEQDRINHFDICDANTEPVFLTYRENKKIELLKQGWASANEAEYDITTVGGIRHEFWVIDDIAVNAAIAAAFNETESLYIADGHHRSASACKVGLKRREEFPNYTGDEEFNFFMAIIFPSRDLHIFDYNRVVKDLNGLDSDEFFQRVCEAGFSVAKAQKSPYRPEAKHNFGMYLDGSWYKLTAGDAIVPDDPREGLDVSVLQNELLSPILGIQDPRTDKRIDFVGGIRGLEELEKRVAKDMRVAFALHPVDIDDLLTISDMGKVMPPKSTWFEPKPVSGLFVHKLSD